MSDYPMLINGQLVTGASQLEVINPATGKGFANVERADEAMLHAAVAAAKAAQPGWARTPLCERKVALLGLASHIEANAKDIARALVREQGKPLAEAELEVSVFAPAYIRYFASQDLEPETIQHDAEYRIEQHYKPLGVIAGITPWNFPFLMACYKLVPALMLGNSMVLKPAPTTPITTLMLADKLREIIPAGVINIIVDDNDLGGILSTHPDVAKVSFTGSTATGRRVMQAAASSLKRLTLELGGNDAGIVLPDADVQKTAKRVIDGAFYNAGQVCIALKRLYVHRSLYQGMCDALSENVRKIVVGDGLDRGTTMGPLQNAKQYDKVGRYLEIAKRDGKIVVGGARNDRPGYFVQPTLVRDIADGSPLVDEEQFGPILPIIPFDEVDEVLKRANGSEYGLGGSVWGADTKKAASVAQQMECGTAWINHHLHFGPHIPFGGAKQSGIGCEFGREGLLEYAQLTIINQKLT